MGWKSPISIGSYVVISYGSPGDPDSNYEQYFKQDIESNPDGKRISFNSTLWQKVYDPNQNSYNGINYELIMSMAGNTPRIILGDAKVEEVPAEQFTKILDADLKPVVWLDRDNSNPDAPILYFALPQSQILSLNQPIEILDADQKPYVLYDEGSRDDDGNLVPGRFGGTINRPVLQMGLPQSQQIQQGVINWIKANENPRIELDLTDVNKPLLNFWLPVAQQIEQGNVTILDANENPYFEIDSTDPDKPILSFWLPQSQIMQNPETKIIGPDETPTVSLDNSNINQPRLEFELPRAVKFYYGSLLGERTEETYTETSEAFAGYGIGDYYVNAATGFIYIVTAIDSNTNTCTFEYVACIQQPLPEIETTSISPYTATGEQNNPQVVKAFTNEEQTTWKLEFQLPKIPQPAIEAEFVGVLEQGQATVSITDPNTMTFNFKIPVGSRMFGGIETDNISVEGAKPGDLYLNTDTGVVYILQLDNTWQVQQGSLKGPVGDILNIVRSYSISGVDTFWAGRDYILDNYKDEEGNLLPLTPDKIFAVTFIDAETSYWYFYTENEQWGRVQLTGGVMNFIDNTWKDSTEDNPITNKTYSIDYINKLIGGTINDNNKDKTTFSKEQVYKLLSWGTWEDAKQGGAL